ncbi:MAG: DUF4389 domain-containing protein [Acidobacteriia bacterium]|nr:DUF4389 domain-containing protein [Terriglobia bacterium]MYG02724.1 DUF4389 domain-containing protein [Terriglobia bacterium]MYK10218.1 DUF4389 domain-containing protein [Terriglobia bacterium]
MTQTATEYAARLEVDYPQRLDRLTTLFRIVLAIPIVFIAALLSASGSETLKDASGETVTVAGSTIGSIIFATALMILFRKRYPRWWFDFLRELTRFHGRVFAYLALLTDHYPSTVDEQGVHLEIDYPDAEHDLNRWLPLIKWLLVLPHLVVLAFLGILAFASVIVAWFSILLTGRYPGSLFEFVVGVWRWGLRVYAYAFLLVTDQYPPFSVR